MNSNNSIRLAVAKAWKVRCAELRLRKGTKGRQRELEALLQGALAVMVEANIMSLSQAQFVAFMVAAGRAEELMEKWASLGSE